jgi:hypothetical protein
MFKETKCQKYNFSWVDSLKVRELSSELKHRGQLATGSKAVLVMRLEEVKIKNYIFFTNKDKFKIGDTVNVLTLINGISYDLEVKVISDALESIPQALENVQVFQPSAPIKPRPKVKINYNECENNETDGDNLFEDEIDPADYSD